MRNPFQEMCIMFISLYLLVVSADLIRGKSQSERSSFIQLNYIVSLSLFLASQSFTVSNLTESEPLLFEAVQLVPFNLVCKERNKFDAFIHDFISV